LIDGHNLIGQLGRPRLEDADDEAQLVLELRAFLARERKKGLVAFDRGTYAAVPDLSSAALTVRFARPPRSADDILLDVIDQERNPRGLIVVTSDHRVQNRARLRGATVIEAHAFGRQLRAAPPPAKTAEPRLSADEVAAWEKIFRERRRQ
jgi:predicted RNA-binding protein with PIN domain